jgi:glycosyltransferase 2 family protein
LSTPTEAAPAEPRPHRRIVPVLVGLVISALLLWWAARGLQIADVLHHVRTAPLAPVLLSVIVSTLVFPIRMLRWRILLVPAAEGPIGVRPAWHAVAIGFMANNLLPLRAGEVLRAWAVSRLAPIRWSSAFASVAVERVFDALTVVGLLVAALLAGSLPPGVRIAGLPADTLAWRVGLIGLAGLLVAGVVLANPAPAAALIRRVVPFRGIAERLVTLLDGVRAGVAALRSPGRLAAIVAWSLAVWGVNALSFLLLFPAFGVPGNLSAALVLQAAIVFGVAVPSSPGYVGVFEAAIVLTLGLYGVPQDRALAYALTYHVTTFVPIILLGLYSLTRTPLHWRDVREHGR